MKSKKRFSRRSKGDILYDILVYILGIIIVFLFFYPLWYILIASFSRPYYVANGDVMFTVSHFTLGAFKKAFTANGIWLGYANAIFITVFGTLVNMAFTTTFAYALSKKELPFRSFFNFITVFTMLFTAGMIPFYQVMMKYGLVDSYWGVMIGFAINTFNVIILRSFFEQVSKEYEEAARMDGASTFTVFFKIILPLSTAALATVTLFYAVSRWNGYFWSSILLKSESKQPLQVVLRKLLVDQEGLVEFTEPTTVKSVFSPTTISYAIIVVSTVPMLILFPFIQKYFKTGVTLGGVKG